MTTMALATTTQHQLGTALALFCVGIVALAIGGLDNPPALVAAIGAFFAGMASLLPALSAFLNARQARRHREADFRRRHRVGP